MDTKRLFRLVSGLLIASSTCWTLAAQGPQVVALPSAATSVKFAAIGDAGTGERPQFDVANQMVLSHAAFPFDQVIMLGDNIYGQTGPEDFLTSFALPYKPLLELGVSFFAALGNHDDAGNVGQPLWNMGGQRYYTHAVKNVRFFALDSNQIDAKQVAWLADALKNSKEDWKVCYFHHPLYSDGGTHGPSNGARAIFEPLFVRYGVTVVFSGHDHVYERLTPQKGISYFVEGASGQLRRGDVKRSPMTAAAFDQDLTFMLVEIDGNLLTFQAITRTGVTVDSGTIQRRSVAR